MAKHAQSIDAKILSRIRKNGRGWVFTASDFADIASSNAIRISLMRAKQAGMIRSVARGIFQYPVHHPVLGLLSPAPDDIVKALARNNNLRFQPTGPQAANALGLSDQVPMKIVYLTDGPSRRLQIGGQSIIFKRASAKNMATAGRLSGLITQAFRYLGPKRVDKDVIAFLRKRLSDKDKKQLLDDARYSPAWIAIAMRQLAL